MPTKPSAIAVPLTTTPMIIRPNRVIPASAAPAPTPPGRQFSLPVGLRPAFTIKVTKMPRNSIARKSHPAPKAEPTLDDLMRAGTGVFGGAPSKVDALGQGVGLYFEEGNLQLTTLTNNNYATGNKVDVPPGTCALACLAAGSNPSGRCILNIDGVWLHIRPSQIIRLKAPPRKATLYQDDGTGTGFPSATTGAVYFAFSQDPDCDFTEIASRRQAILIARVNLNTIATFTAATVFYIQPNGTIVSSNPAVLDATQFAGIGLSILATATGGGTISIGLAGFANGNQAPPQTLIGFAGIATAAALNGRAYVGEGTVDNTGTDTLNGITYNFTKRAERWPAVCPAFVITGVVTAVTGEIDLWGIPA